MPVSAHLYMSNEKVDLPKNMELKIKIIRSFCFTLIPAADDPALPCEIHSKFVLVKTEPFKTIASENLKV